MREANFFAKKCQKTFSKKLLQTVANYIFIYNIINNQLVNMQQFATKQLQQFDFFFKLLQPMFINVSRLTCLYKSIKINCNSLKQTATVLQQRETSNSKACNSLTPCNSLFTNSHISTFRALFFSGYFCCS